jgi:1,4-dihydroxy-2-naphthoate octaprenyltransferase
MKKAMVITAFITLIIALFLIYLSFGKEDFLHSLLFFGLGIASIIAALKYTIGNNAYGYSGFGDLFVFLFFGLLSVLGSYYLFTHQLQWDLLLPASTIGLLSMAVLNLNNMRDIKNDAKNNKNTLVVKMGIIKSKIYHYSIVIISFILIIVYTLLNYDSPKQFFFLIAFVPIAINLFTVYKNKKPNLLDSELKKVALSTFLIAILMMLFF